jgi:uncharacterized DUF497 family protein
MAFEWDAAKNAANIAKHGIDFEDAIQIFDGPVLEKADHRREYGEARIIAFGAVDDRELAVVYTMRGRAPQNHIGEEGHIAVSAKHTTRRTPSSRRRGKTDWARVDAMSGHEIAAAAKADPDAAPILDKEWFRTAKLILPERKVPISLRMDREVVEWFKARGRRYQSRINAVLKAYVHAHRETG